LGRRNHYARAAYGGRTLLSPAVTRAQTGSDRPERFSALSFRGPLAAHLLTLVAGLVFLLHLDSKLWFFGDDWDFLLDRGLHHPALSIWQPHNEHWSTLPILLWRLLFSTVGLSYGPYLWAALACHVILAHLIWRVCLRGGVHPWIATLMVGVFVVLGAGAENLTWAFQIGFIGSVMFGFAALEAIEGATLIRDGVASAFLLAGLMCSTIGDTCVVVVGIVLLHRSGWRRTVRVLVVPVVAYAIWYLLVGHHAVSQDHITLNTVYKVPTYVWTGLSSALGQTFGLAAVGPALLVGVLAWVLYRGGVTYQDHPAIIATAAGAAVFFTVAGLGRSGLGATEADASRYVYVTMAFMLPLLATMLSAAAARWSGALLLAGVVVVAVGLGNIGQLQTFAEQRTTLVQSEKTNVLTTGTLLAEGVHSLSLAPVQYDPNLTATALSHHFKSGQLHRIAVSTQERLNVEATLEVALAAQRVAGAPFELLANSASTSRMVGFGCVTLSPTGPGSQVALRAAHGGSALEILTIPNAVLPLYLHSVTSGTTSTPVTPMAAPNGKSYLEDLDSKDELVATLPAGAPTTLCNVSVAAPSGT
jgi:hypothetical protein